MAIEGHSLSIPRYISGSFPGEGPDVLTVQYYIYMHRQIDTFIKRYIRINSAISSLPGLPQLHLSRALNNAQIIIT